MENLKYLLKFDHILASVMRPSANGVVERANRSILEFCRKFLDNNEWSELIPFIRFALNTTVNSATNQTPFNMMFLRTAVFPYDTILQSRTYYSPSYEYLAMAAWKKSLIEAKKHQTERFESNKRLYDKNSREGRVLKPGDLIVYDRTTIDTSKGKKFQSLYEHPSTVIKVEDNYVVVRHPVTGEEKRLHIDRVKITPPFIQRRQQ